MPKLSLSDLSLKGKKVLLRVDFNVPLNEEGTITDDSRIIAALPSIRYMLNQGASIILLSHLGRPKGNHVKKLSLAPCAKRLKELLNCPVKLAPDCIGSEVEQLSAQLRPGEILLLENLRFHPEEESPEENPRFVKALAKLGDVYVNDAFGTAHRAHASTETIAHLFPEKAAAGFLMEKEIKFLGDTLFTPKRPFLAIIGGAKISTKMGTLKSLLKNVNQLILGGAMANTFFKAKGFKIGNSLHEEDQLDAARFLLNESKKLGIEIILPIDIVIAQEIKKGTPTKLVNMQDGIPDGWSAVDCGPDSINYFVNAIEKSNTILWNGPLGVFEIDEFSKGTLAIAHALAGSSAITIIGGGDSLAAVQKAHVSDKMTHLSTGGGASLEYIEFGTLPGIEALSNKKEFTTI